MSDLAYFLLGASFGLGMKILIAIFDALEEMIEQKRKAKDGHNGL
jgi:hypothetical protein